mgnify:CR=1 FL=1
MILADAIERVAFLNGIVAGTAAGCRVAGATAAVCAGTGGSAGSGVAFVAV